MTRALADAREHGAAPFDARRLRHALGCFPTGVAVVTAGDLEGVRVGVTVNSFASVSLEPPLVQFALHVQARCLSAFVRPAPFAISLLRSDQRVASETFARSSSIDWSRVALDRIDPARFAVAGALATFSCTVQKRVAAGDHVLLIGRIVAAAWDTNAPALAYFRGRYDSIAGTRPGTESAPELAGSAHALGWG